MRADIGAYASPVDRGPSRSSRRQSTPATPPTAAPTGPPMTAPATAPPAPPAKAPVPAAGLAGRVVRMAAVGCSSHDNLSGVKVARPDIWRKPSPSPPSNATVHHRPLCSQPRMFTDCPLPTTPMTGFWVPGPARTLRSRIGHGHGVGIRGTGRNQGRRRDRKDEQSSHEQCSFLARWDVGQTTVEGALFPAIGAGV